MAVVTTIPKEKAKAFTHKLTKALSSNHSLNKVDMIDHLNRQLMGWAAFYKFTDFTARTFQKIDRIVFWKLAHWMAHKHRCRVKSLMRKWVRAPEAGKAKTWIVGGISEQGNRVVREMRRLVGSPKGQFRWKNPEINPYVKKIEPRSTITSRYHDVAMAMGQA